MSRFLSALAVGASIVATKAHAVPCAQWPATAQMYAKLQPTCAGCHTSGTMPYFSSSAAFENLVAYNPRYVVPGHPEQSYLVKLLQGQGNGTYKQMPLTGEPFSQLASEGKTQASMQDVLDWITNLPPRTQTPGPDASAVSIQRLSAEQMRATLYKQLGLSDADFMSLNGSNYGTLEFVSRGPDQYPVFSTDDAHGIDSADPVFRSATLGGLHSLASVKRDTSTSTPFALSLQPISQAWCKIAINKMSSQALLFPNVAPTAPSASSAAAIKQNIGHLALHFLGEPSTPDDVNTVFDNVFVPLESASDPKTAWAGVCSYFIRHPKWVFY
jgi:hypothetical protein